MPEVLGCDPEPSEKRERRGIPSHPPAAVLYLSAPRFQSPHRATRYRYNDLWSLPYLTKPHTLPAHLLSPLPSVRPTSFPSHPLFTDCLLHLDVYHLLDNHHH